MGFRDGVGDGTITLTLGLRSVRAAVAAHGVRPDGEAFCDITAAFELLRLERRPGLHVPIVCVQGSALARSAASCRGVELTSLSAPGTRSAAPTRLINRLKPALL